MNDLNYISPKKDFADQSGHTNNPIDCAYNYDIIDYINYFQSADDDDDYEHILNDNDISFLNDNDLWSQNKIIVPENTEQEPLIMLNYANKDDIKNDTINKNDISQYDILDTGQIDLKESNTDQPARKESQLQDQESDNLFIRANSRRKNMLSLKSDEILFKDAFYHACGLSTKCDKKYVQKLYHMVCSSIGLREMSRNEKRSIDLFFKNFCKYSILIINAVKRCLQDNPDIKQEIYQSKFNGKKI